jgi:hypothetical protein
MTTEEVKTLVRAYENRIATFWNHNGMLEYQDREISHSQMKRNDEYQAAVDKARQDLYDAIEAITEQRAM